MLAIHKLDIIQMYIWNNNQDLTKRNQDCFFCDPNFDVVEENGIKSTCCFFGVFDGHGQEGDKCSRFVRDNVITSWKLDFQLPQKPSII